jgi:hypothetical protein
MLGDGVEDLKTSIGHKPESWLGATLAPHAIQAQFDPVRVTHRHCDTTEPRRIAARGGSNRHGTEETAVNGAVNPDIYGIKARVLQHPAAIRLRSICRPFMPIPNSVRAARVEPGATHGSP